MMKRNYFGKFLAIAMVFAGFSLTSCDENDNAIIDGKVWVKPEVQLVDGGAIIKGSSTKDINTMLGRVRQQIIQAANNGEKFTIDIETSVLNSTADDNTLNIAAVDKGDIVLNLPGNIVTDVPLMIQAMGVADDTPPSTSPTPNKVEINIPSSASNIDLGINMPNSTVTLKGGTIDNLAAKTAYNTLVIESGVTVNWLKMLGGRAEVKEGGKVLGYLRDGTENEEEYYDSYDARIYKDGVRPLLGVYGYDVYYIKDNTQEPYYAKNLKAIKGEKVRVVNTYLYNGQSEDYADIVIADGAAVSFAYGSYIDDEGIWHLPKANIKGEGNKTARICQGSLSKYIDSETGEPYYTGSIDIRFVKEMSNVTVDATTRPAYGDNSSGEWEYSEVEVLSGSITLPESSTDCNFKAPGDIEGYTKNRIQSKVTNCTLVCKEREDYSRRIYSLNVNNCDLTADQISDISAECENTSFKSNSVAFTNDYISGNSATLKSCKFEASGKNPYSSIKLPYQTDKRSSFKFIFDNCQLAKDFRLTTSFSSNKPWLDKDGKLITKYYYWYELNEAGDDYPKNDEGAYIYSYHRSPNESDIPEANKNNGRNFYNDNWNMIGYGDDSNINGFADDDQSFKDFKCYITFDGTTLGGAAITDKTEIIRDGSSSIATKKDKDGNVTTKTYFVIGGKNYEAIYNSNTTKWLFVDAE